MGAMPYVRPAIDVRKFRDDQGNVIPYASRWPIEGPPEWAYSQEAHPERFLPIFDVARALVEYLECTYDVPVTSDGDSWSFQPDGDGAPLRIELDRAAVSARIQAGSFIAVSFPSCGCDACDDDVLDIVTALAEMVFAVVRGVAQEKIEGRWLVTTFVQSDSKSRIERSDRRRYKQIVAAAPKRWSAWAVRSPSSGGAQV
jgi:hypothetical protein